MELSDIKSLKSGPRKILNKEGWTVEKLATTTAPILAKYRGISLKGAGKIIEEARDLVNEGWQETTNHLPGPISPAPEVEVGMSARVRRILMGSDQGWQK